jgi:carboxymethylenebutenolidase
MNLARFVPVLLLALGLFAGSGCGAAPPPNPDPSDAAKSPPSVAEGMTGSLSEEAFKALHELKTDAPPKLNGQDITFDGVSGYMSLPDPTKPARVGIVVIHEWWGLNDNIRHWSDRLAKDGYAALAIDLYGGVVAKTPDEAMKAMKAVDEKKALSHLIAAADFLEKDPRILAEKTGAIGWCFGGAWSLRLAMAEPNLDAAVIYYGHLVNNPDELKPIKAEILGIFGNRDKAITPEDVNAFDAALGTAKVKHTIFRYDADHAFANPSNPRYEQKSATDAWAKVHDFFGKTLAK